MMSTHKSMSGLGYPQWQSLKSTRFHMAFLIGTLGLHLEEISGLTLLPFRWISMDSTE
jgi:hypothetical protein